MRTLCILAAALAVIALVEGESYKGYKIYETTPADDTQVHALNQLDNLGFDFLMLSRLAGRPAHILVSPIQETTLVAFLKAKHLSYSIIQSDVEKAVLEERLQNVVARARSNGRISFDRYLRHDEINEYVDSVAAENPSIVTVEDAGLSFEGRVIKTVTISSGGGGSKPAIAMDAGIHAREWISPALALYIIDQLIKPENSDLLENADWIIIPLINPDGYEFTHTNSRFWRKTRSTNAGSTCFGTDGNRNFDYWWMHDGASNSPCSDIFAGPSPLSEPETQILAKLLHSRDNIHLYLALHSYGQYILYPWGYANVLPDDWQDLHNLGLAAGQAIYDASGARYAVGSSTQLMYAAAGASDDYAKGAAGVKYSYTIELPGNGFDPPATQILSIVTGTFPGIRVFGKYIAENF